jgi:formate hydrogenlyase subunit 3/multisubunit Na+/H+ antiporter MnhD subunit
LWLLSAILTPLVVAGFPASRRASGAAILAPLPALALALANPTFQVVTLDWLLLGVSLGLDDTGRLYLLASALIWLLAAVHARDSLRVASRAGRFQRFFLLAMAGNFSLILAQDMLSFYLGFTLMGLSAAGLVAHRGCPKARRAGRLYLVWTLFGEVLLFSALILMAAQAGGLEFAALQGSLPDPFAVLLLLTGFGIKLALPGLHVWLPLSYAAAPVAGVAVLSGPMISAGLLGWIRFLPPGSEALVVWGMGLIAIGLIGVVYGTLIGLMQQDPRVVLGYSSISKMGLLTAGFGIALAHPQSSSALLPVITLYAINHLLVKSTLFIGVDLLERGRARRWVLSGMLLLGLMLAGAPLTNGGLAKAAFAAALPESTSWFGLWLVTAAVATSLLMGRLAFLLWQARTRQPPASGYALGAWLLLVTALVLWPLLTAGVARESLSGGLPLAGALLLILVLWRYPAKWLGAWVGRIPPGDILQPAAQAARRLGKITPLTSFSWQPQQLRLAGWQRWKDLSAWLPGQSSRQAEVTFSWGLAGALWMLLVSLILFAILRP